MKSAIDIYAHAVPDHFLAWADQHTPHGGQTLSTFLDNASVDSFEQTLQLFFASPLFESQAKAYFIDIFEVSLIASNHLINFYPYHPIESVQQYAFRTEQLTALTDSSSEQLLSLQ